MRVSKSLTENTCSRGILKSYFRFRGSAIDAQRFQYRGKDNPKLSPREKLTLSAFLYLIIRDVKIENLRYQIAFLVNRWYDINFKPDKAYRYLVSCVLKGYVNYRPFIRINHFKKPSGLFYPNWPGCKVAMEREDLRWGPEGHQAIMRWPNKMNAIKYGDPSKYKKKDRVNT